ncbi:MAG: response regulator, partial [Verrucomicrobia bacterium]|nr:response regulator [Verrucomicrobiota bacterium]
MTAASDTHEPATAGHLLIVDDDRGMLRLLEKSLRRERFTTTTAASGQEAIAWLERHQPDLLLLDLNLPDIAGQALLQRLAAMGRAVPFVAITGYSDVQVAVELMRQGAVDYLVKD